MRIDIGSQLAVPVTATSGLWSSSDPRIMAKEPQNQDDTKY